MYARLTDGAVAAPPLRTAAPRQDQRLRDRRIAAPLRP
jgi:hypothetical protein